MIDADVLVVGAGPVGATFALLAKAQGLRVALIEARAGPSTETRSLALSHGSRVLLERAGAWQPTLQPSEIHAIHTSQQGGFGRVRLSREDADVPALGYVVGYAALQATLDTALMAAGIPVTFGARVTTIEPAANRAKHPPSTATGDCGDGATVAFSHGDNAVSVTAGVVVLADGGANLDKLPDVVVDEKDYGQSAMLATVAADRPHQRVAFERFTPGGPLALLPYDGENEYAAVWVASHAEVATLMSCTDAEVCAQFQRQFGTRAGRFASLTNRRSYPLRLRQTSTRVAGRVVIVGNAAQAMHPVAGQGFNLGLRDAQTLAALLGRAPIEAALKKYDAAREQDVLRGVGFTDLLATTFLSDIATLRIPRGLVLAAVDMLPAARRALAGRMMFGAQS